MLAIIFRGIVIAVGTVVLAILLQLCIRLILLIRRRNIWKKLLEKFAGPTPHWLFGNLHQLKGKEKMLELIEDHVKRYKKCSPFWVGPLTPVMRLYHPDYVQTICRTAEPKYKEVYRFLEPWLGKGLLISEGEQWARTRRLLTPAFHFDILKSYIKVFCDSTAIMMDKWRLPMMKSDITSKSFDMFEHVSLMTLDSILKCAFTYESDVQRQGKSNPYIKAVYELSELTMERGMFLPYHIDFIYNLSYSGYRFRKACRVAHDLSERLIASRRKALSEKGDHETKRKYQDFLDILLAAKDADGKGLTDREIRNEVDTFLFRGHDTTASGISWCLYNLARHPEYQDKCREEVNRVMGDKEILTWDDMQELNMLTMCIKESLRLHSPVPAVSRQITKPLTLPDNRTIPEDFWVTVAINGMHHNPEVWKEPEQYDPYRFTPENSSKRSPHAFLPFSAGPRNCIGQNFAMNEMRTCIALLLKNFSFTVDEGKEVKRVPEIVLRGGNGLWLNVSPIKTE